MKVEQYQKRLRQLESWDDYLLNHSNLPGPRGNIELAQAVAREGDAQLFQRYLNFDAEQAPTNTPHEFLAFCGTVGLGKLLAEGDLSVLRQLRQLAADPRWRIREGVAMALQNWGAHDMSALIAEMQDWSKRNLYEKRAAMAALCEPKLLKNETHATQVLELLNQITHSIQTVADRKQDAFRVLRKGLAYGWSVAIVAHPALGKALFEQWLASPDKDILFIIKENLKKNRLLKMDPTWTKELQNRLYLKLP